MQAAVAFAVGVGSGTCGQATFRAQVGWALAAAGLVAAILFARHRCVRRASLLLALIALGLLRTTVPSPFPEWLLRRPPFLHEITGTVVSYPSFGERHVTFTVRLDVIPAHVRVTWLQDEGVTTPIRYGDRLRLVGTIRLPEPFSGFDYPAYLARRGVFATMIVEDGEGIDCIGRSGNPILVHGDRLRQRLLCYMRDALSPTDAALAQGLLLGDRSALSDEVEDAFRRTGLMHVLAVSGLHLGIVLAGAWFVLRRLGVRPLIAYPMVGVLVLLVLWVVGPRVSLLRATLLFAFLGLGSVLADLGLILRRSIRPMNGLASAAIVLLALHPGELFDAGFQLTFAATAGILVVVSPSFRLKWEPWIEGAAGRTPFRAGVRYALTLILISLAAQAGAAPIVAWHFHAFHPLVGLANLVVIPLVTVALGFGFFATALSGSFMLSLLAVPFAWLLRALSWVVQVLAGFPLTELVASHGFAAWLAALAGFTFLAWRYSEEWSL
jgi:competence protein ComEC